MVSVIIPTHGGGEDLEKVIESITNQSYGDIEIIVVDDNGYGTVNQKKTAEVLKKYTDGGNVEYITHPKNMGGATARNTGAKASKGDYLMFLDDDDTVSPDKIEKQIEAIQDSNGKCGISYCSTKVFVEGKLSNVIKAKKSGDILYEYMMGKINMGTGTVLMVREAWESLGGYDESFIRHQDWEFFARVLNKYYAVAVPDVYFNRYITNRNLPREIDLLEKHTDHYIAFLKEYSFRLPKGRIRRIINMNNSRIALSCIKLNDYKRFFKTMSKYDNALRSYTAFLFFAISVCIDKLIGKKS